jgi:hypothetical protein
MSVWPGRGWKLGGAVVEPEAQDRHGRGARPRLPALVGETGHPQGLQGVQHPPRLGNLQQKQACDMKVFSLATMSTNQRHARISPRSCRTSGSPRTGPPRGRRTSRPGSWSPTATRRRSTSPPVCRFLHPHERDGGDDARRGHQAQPPHVRTLTPCMQGNCTSRATCTASAWCCWSC